MRAFVVSVNGDRACTIGVGDNGVLSAHVTWVGKPGVKDDLFLHAGGLDSSTDEHFRWPVPSLRVGDRVSIEVVEAAEVDPPAGRDRNTRRGPTA